jgi:uncharacterized membrane protein HdeD (DUF308 family)
MQLFLIRGLAALAWAIGFATVSDSLATTAAVLLVAYPTIDLIASLIDAEGQRGSTRTLLRVDAGVSAAAAVGLAIAATGDTGNVLVVFGAWAVVTGVGQVAVALRRRVALGRQWPMLIAGGLSTLVGVFYIAAAGGDDPKLDPLAIYAAGGGAFFVIQAGLLARRRRRLVAT